MWCALVAVSTLHATISLFFPDEPPPPRLVPVAAERLEEVAVPDLGVCDDLTGADELETLALALEREADVVERMRGTLQIGDRALTPEEYAETTLRPLAALARRGAPALCAALATEFVFYRNPDPGPGKFTAYYHPTVKGSRRRHGRYQHPLYRRPDDETLASLATEDILDGRLDDRGLELVWLDDPTLPQEIHLQGSATVLLDDGSTMYVGTHGSNGRRFRGVTRFLRADGKLPTASPPPGMSRARMYFADHPDEIEDYWKRNPRYVFFRETTDPGRGRHGALTPWRSVAVDPTWLPLGSVLWIRTEQPVVEPHRGRYRTRGRRSYGRLVLAQDTGSAIQGPARVDIFYGAGEEAVLASHLTRGPGEAYVVVAK